MIKSPACVFLSLPLPSGWPWCFPVWPCWCSMPNLLGTMSNKLSFNGSHPLICWPYCTSDLLLKRYILKQSGINLTGECLFSNELWNSIALSLASLQIHVGSCHLPPCTHPDLLTLPGATEPSFYIWLAMTWSYFFLRISCTSCLVCIGQAFTTKSLILKRHLLVVHIYNAILLSH